MGLHKSERKGERLTLLSALVPLSKLGKLFPNNDDELGSFSLSTSSFIFAIVIPTMHKYSNPQTNTPRPQQYKAAKFEATRDESLWRR